MLVIYLVTLKFYLYTIYIFWKSIFKVTAVFPKYELLGIFIEHYNFIEYSLYLLLGWYSTGSSVSSEDLITHKEVEFIL